MVMLQLLNYLSASEILKIISAKMSNLNCIHFTILQGSLVAQLVKNLPAVWETWVQSLGWDDPVKKGKATHSDILAWRIPWSRKKLDMTEKLLLSSSYALLSISQAVPIINIQVQYTTFYHKSTCTMQNDDPKDIQYLDL